MSKYLLLDGHNLAYRAHFSLPNLTRRDNFPTGALHGFFNTLLKLKKLEAPESMVCFFDSKGGSERHLAVHAHYKAQRETMPEALQEQLPYLKQLSEYLGYPVVEIEGLEADDLIGSYAKKLSERGDHVVIVSSDKDLCQCVNEHVCQLLPAPTANPKIGWKKLKPADVETKFGIPPRLIADYLTLVGDSSDNLKGVEGVGPKTAAKWLKNFQNLKGILKNLETLKPKRFRERLKKMEHQLLENLKLFTLLTSCPVNLNLKSPPQQKALLGLLKSMEMNRSAKQAELNF